MERPTLTDTPSVRVLIPADFERRRPRGIKFACVHPSASGRHGQNGEASGLVPEVLHSDRFGSWCEALTAAGIDAERCPQPTAVELGIDLRRLSAWLDRTPTKADVRDHGQYTVTAYRDTFGSWEAASTAVFDTSSQPSVTHD